jgi:hypothetical protein
MLTVLYASQKPERSPFWNGCIYGIKVWRRCNLQRLDLLAEFLYNLLTDPRVTGRNTDRQSSDIISWTLFFKEKQSRLQRSIRQRTQNIFDKLFATVTTLSLAQTKIPLTEVYPLLCFGDVSAAVLHNCISTDSRVTKLCAACYVAMERFPYAEKYKKKS